MNPPGLCQCGCGQKTKIAPETNRRYGYVKGQPLRFIHGHNTRGMKRRHSLESRKRMSISQRRRFADPGRHPRWKGGVIKRYGYVWIHLPTHPYANRHGYVKRARLIAEQALGRYLKPHEVVHHINRIRDDDRNENLLICTKAYHDWLHGRLRQGLNGKGGKR